VISPLTYSSAFIEGC